MLLSKRLTLENFIWNPDLQHPGDTHTLYYYWGLSPVSYRGSRALSWPMSGRTKPSIHFM